MFFNKKIDPLLRSVIDDDIYNKYRVIVQYGSISGSIEKKIRSFKGEVIYNIKSINCICTYINKRGLKRILELPDVKYVFLDEPAYLCSKNILNSNGVFLDNKNYSLLKDKKLSGKGIGIGIIDSGVYPHIDLSTPTNKIKHFIDIINNINFPYDDNGHGTFISGILCGESSNSKKGKQRGICVNSDLVMVKAFNKFGKGYVSSTLFALEQLYRISDEYNIRVICAPFEVPTLNKIILRLYDELFTMLKNKNILIVVPSGNNENHEDTIKGIALSDKVITVGGLNTNSSYMVSEYSCCGSIKNLKKPDFIAASDEILSLNTDKNYISERNGEKLYPHPLNTPYTVSSGTSIACAFIAGLCALLLEFNNIYTFDDIYTLFKINSVLINDKKYKQGHGYINISNLINNLDFNNDKLSSKIKDKKK